MCYGVVDCNFKYRESKNTKLPVLLHQSSVELVAGISQTILPLSVFISLAIPQTTLVSIANSSQRVLLTT